MKTNLLKLLTCLCIFSVHVTNANAFGGMDGGGGGAYRLINGQVVTLPEFGVLIKESAPSTTGKKYARYFRASSEARNELQKINSRLNQLTALKGFDLKEVLPDDGVIFVQSQVDAAQYAKIKNEYKKTLASFGFVFEDEKFILPAITEDGKTYILPDFQSLNPTQQAKILIHETSMRRKLASTTSNEKKARLIRLQKALILDGAIEKMLTADDKEFDLERMLKALANLNYVDESEVFNSLFRQMLIEVGDYVPADQLLIWHKVLGDSDILDPSLIQDLQERHKLKKNYAEMFESMYIFANGALHFSKDEDKTILRYKESDDICNPLEDRFKRYRAFVIYKNEVRYLACASDVTLLVPVSAGRPSDYIKSFFN